MKCTMVWWVLVAGFLLAEAGGRCTAGPLEDEAAELEAQARTKPTEAVFDRLYRHYSLKEDHPVAGMWLRRSIELRPTEAKYGWLLDTFRKAGMAGELEAAVAEAVAAFPGARDRFTRSGVDGLIKSGATNAAVRLAAGYAATGPTNAAVVLDLGRQMRRAREHELAADLLTLHVHLATNAVDEQVAVERAECLRDAGRSEEAFAAAQQVLVSAQNGWARERASRLLTALLVEHPGAANRLAQFEADGVAATNALWLVTAARVRERRGETEQALPLYRRAAEITGAFDDRRRLMETLTRLQRWDGALEVAQGLLEDFPDQKAELRKQVFRIYRGAGRNERAIEAGELMVEVAANRSEALAELAECCVRWGDRRRAAEYYRQAASESGAGQNRPRYRLQAAKLLAELDLETDALAELDLLALGEGGDAFAKDAEELRTGLARRRELAVYLDDLRGAADREMTGTVVRLAYAEACRGAMRYEEAARVYAQVAAIEPDPVRWQDLGVVYEYAGNTEKAVEAYGRFLEKSSPSPQTDYVVWALVKLRGKSGSAALDEVLRRHAGTVSNAFVRAALAAAGFSGGAAAGM